MTESVNVAFVGGPEDGKYRALHEGKAFVIVQPVRTADGFGQREMGRYVVTDRRNREGWRIAEWKENRDADSRLRCQCVAPWRRVEGRRCTVCGRELPPNV